MHRSIPRSEMDGTTTMKKRAALAAVALLAIGGAIAPLAASTDAAEAGPAATLATDADLPRFAPSQDPFADGFAAFEDPAPVGVPGHAVDIATVEPAEELEDIPDGVASWYGARFAGRKTASGERFDPNQLTAAHRTLPFGSKVRVTRGGRSVVVRINDRGPFHGDRVIDLSQAAAAELGLVRSGSGHVELALLAS